MSSNNLRCVAVLILMVSLLFSCATIPNEIEQESQLKGEFALATMTGEGSNPYLSNLWTVTQISELTFAKLLCIKQDFTLQYDLLETIQNEQYTVTITIKQGRYFSDKQPVTIQDVSASLDAARNSIHFKQRFRGVLRAEIVNDQLVIHLKEPAFLFEYLLDFPILKSGETSLLNPTSYSGLYQKSANDLVVNSMLPTELQPIIKKITLQEVQSYSEAVELLNIGKISLLSVEQERASYNSQSVKRLYYETNNLVFIGLNSDRALFSSNASRRSVAALIDKAQLVKYAFSSGTKVTQTPFNVLYPYAKELQPAQETSKQNAVDYLKEQGFINEKAPQTDESTQEKPLKKPVTILYNEQDSAKKSIAEIVAENLMQEGIEAELFAARDMENYITNVQNKNFDMYIGEIKLYNDMSLGSFFYEGGAAAYGIKPSKELYSAYSAAKQSQKYTQLFCELFINEQPFIPIAFKQDSVIYSGVFTGFEPTAGSILFFFNKVN